MRTTFLYRLVILLIICGNARQLYSQEFTNYSSNPVKYNMRFADSAAKMSDFYFCSGNFDKAIDYCKVRLKKIEETIGVNNIDYALTQAELSLCYANIGNLDNAIYFAKDASLKIEALLGHDSFLMGILLNNISIYYAKKKVTNKTVILKNEILSMIKKICGDDIQGYLSVLLRQNNFYSIFSNEEVALKIREEITSYKTKIMEQIDQAVVLHDSSLVCSHNGDYKQATKLCEEALSIFGKYMGENDEVYYQALINLSSYYAEEGKFEEAYNISEKYSKLCQANYGENSIEYAKSLSSFAQNCSFSKDYNKAIKLEEKAIEIFKNNFQTHSKEYAISLSNLANLYYNLGYYYDAIRYNEQAIAIMDGSTNQAALRGTLLCQSACYNRIGRHKEALILAKKGLSLFDGKKEDVAYYDCLSYLADCYSSMKEYDKSISILEDILQFQKKTIGEKNPRYIKTLEDLSYNYAKKNRMRDAIMTQKKAVKIAHNIYSKNHVEYASCLSLLGHIYFLVGDRENSIICIEKSSSIIKNILGENNIDYIHALTTLSNSYPRTTKAIEIGEKISDLLQIMNQTDTPEYINNLHNLAYNYSALGDTTKSSQIINEILDNSYAKNLFNNDTLKYARFLEEWAECLMLQHDYMGAINKSFDAIANYLKVVGNDIEYFEGALLTIISCYAYQNDTVNLLLTLKEYPLIENIQKKVSQNLRLLSSSQMKMDYWSVFIPVFENMLPIIAASAPNDDYAVSTVYNMSALFAKGIILKKDIEIAELVNHHSDHKLRQTYSNYLANRELFLKSDILGKNDSITMVIEQQEDSIRQSLWNLGLFDTQLSTWNEVQKQLRDDDIAIEFLSFRTDVNSLDYYNMALLLKKNYKHPMVIELPNNSQIERHVNHCEWDSIYIDIWQPMEKELESVKNIYFSPSGMVHGISIEYLPDGNKMYMNEKYNIYRLSSTGKLIDRQINSNYKTAVIYGGLDYDCDEYEVLVNSEEEFLSGLVRGVKDSLMTRNGFDYLPNTSIEISNIMEILKKSNISSIAYSGKNGTEESFKKLSSSNKKDIIHISTHGKYIRAADTDEQIHNNLMFLMDSNFSSSIFLDEQLSRSFLVMSGGNRLPKHKTIPIGMEDGILTAREIANVDLFDVELVVLSACQTGLGDITADGVWGLQRGFKKAGAKTILMSLDKVDDEATRILMVEFYKNLMSGRSKYQSLKNAQKHLRSVENGKYNAPKYWASFIMLDGLN